MGPAAQSKYRPKTMISMDSPAVLRVAIRAPACSQSSAFDGYRGHVKVRAGRRRRSSRPGRPCCKFGSKSRESYENLYFRAVLKSPKVIFRCDFWKPSNLTNSRYKTVIVALFFLDKPESQNIIATGCNNVKILRRFQTETRPAECNAAKATHSCEAKTWSGYHTRY